MLVEEDEDVRAGFSADATDLGGHSRLSLSSSFTASAVCCDKPLEVRGIRGGEDVEGLDLFCCSKRPIRLATLARGRSSGRGLR